MEPFYKLTVAQRDSAWREIEALAGEVAELRRLLRIEHMGRLGIGHAIVDCPCKPRNYVSPSAIPGVSPTTYGGSADG